MPLTIIRNDITKMQVDAIVNTANPRPVVGGGVDRAIHRAAGPELLAARRKIGDIAAGAAFITPGYGLPSKSVIHTVGPVWRGGSHRERELLAACYENSLALAEAHDCHSVAFPLISAGIFGCPADIAIATAVQAIRDFLQQHECEMDVYFVVFDRESFQLSGRLFDDVKSYLDEHYVEEHLEKEYRGDDRRRRLQELMPSAQPCDERLMESPCILPSKSPTAEQKLSQKRSLDDWLEAMDDTFSESLLRLIDAKGRKDPEVYSGPMSIVSSSRRYATIRNTSRASGRRLPLRWRSNSISTRRATSSRGRATRSRTATSWTSSWSTSSCIRSTISSPSTRRSSPLASRCSAAEFVAWQATA